MLSDFPVAFFLLYLGLRSLAMVFFGGYGLILILVGLYTFALGVGLFFSGGLMIGGNGWQYRWIRLSLYTFALIGPALIVRESGGDKNQIIELIPMVSFLMFNLIAQRFWIHYMPRAKPGPQAATEENPQ